MNINQFLGIPDIGSTMSHEEKYSAVVNAVGLDNCIRFIPTNKGRIIGSLRGGDEHLNTIPLSSWDAQYYAFKWTLSQSVGITSITLAEAVCTLKQAAKMWVKQSD